MAKPIARSMEEAISLGFEPLTLSTKDIRALIDEQKRTNPDSQAFARDCLTLPPGETQCLQTDCGSDGWEIVGFCDGLTCVTARRRCTR